MARGQIAKAKILEKILQTFEGSFMHEKELGCEFIIKKQHIENEERIITDFIIKRK